MKELSLNILDIAENSVKAGATEVALTLSGNRRHPLNLPCRTTAAE